MLICSELFPCCSAAATLVNLSLHARSCTLALYQYRSYELLVISVPLYLAANTFIATLMLQSAAACCCCCNHYCVLLLLCGVQLLGTKDERKRVCDTMIAPGKFNVLVTSYECVLKEKATLTKISWKYLMIDEAHRIKVRDSCFK